MITQLLRKLKPAEASDVPNFVAESLKTVNFTIVPVMSRKYNFIEFWSDKRDRYPTHDWSLRSTWWIFGSLGFRSAIEDYEETIASSTLESRPKTSQSLSSTARSLSPIQGANIRSSHADARHKIRLAHKRVTSALKCNLVIPHMKVVSIFFYQFGFFRFAILMHTFLNLRLVAAETLQQRETMIGWFHGIS